MAEQSNQQMQVKISDDMLKGFYANAMQVYHTQEEFILDFMNLFPPNGVIGARVVVSPGHVKRIALALQENIKKFEETFGSIKAEQVSGQAAQSTQTVSGKIDSFERETR